MGLNTIAVVGVGLIGGSFALAMRKAGFRGRVIGVSSSKATGEALGLGVIDQAAPLDEALPQADLVYLAQPIERILATLPRLDPFLKEGALVTDAGSTKAQIAETGRRSVTRGQFLGGHPMAGKETRGVAEAEADLFAGRTYVLTPDGPQDLETPAAEEFLEWIRRIGGVPVILDPAEHDRVVSWTSHLPQLASTALAGAVARGLDIGGYSRVAGPGLRDMTRLALSPFDIWKDILDTNRPEIERALDAYIEELKDLRARVAAPGLAGKFEKGAEFAARLRQMNQENA